MRRLIIAFACLTPISVYAQNSPPAVAACPQWAGALATNVATLATENEALKVQLADALKQIAEAAKKPPASPPHAPPPSP
jgi:hypothetical protein